MASTDISIRDRNCGFHTLEYCLVDLVEGQFNFHPYGMAFFTAMLKVWLVGFTHLRCILVGFTPSRCGLVHSYCRYHIFTMRLVGFTPLLDDLVHGYCRFRTFRLWPCPWLISLFYTFTVWPCPRLLEACRFHTFAVRLVGFTSFGVAFSTAIVDLTPLRCGL